MANNQMLTPLQTVIDFAAEFGYPATAAVEVQNFGGGGQRHLIVYDADPSTNGYAAFAQAPNGSRIEYPTAHHTYLKSGAVGSGVNGTWAMVA